jgi:hypothetical protein
MSPQNANFLSMSVSGAITAVEFEGAFDHENNVKPRQPTASRRQ